MRFDWISVFRRRATLNSPFESSKIEYQLKCIRNTSLCVAITLIIYFISTIIRGTSDILSLIGLPIIFILTILLFLSTKNSKAKYFAPIGFTVFLIVIMVGVFQLSFKYFQGDSKKEVFMSAFVANSIMSLALLSRLSWISVFLLLGIQSALVCSLINVDEPRIKTVFTPEIPLVAIAVLTFFSQITFQLDSFERIRFQEKEKKGKALESIKKVLCSSLPDQIIVFPRDIFKSRKVYFVNEAASQTFNTLNEREITRKLELMQFSKITTETQNDLFQRKCFTNVPDLLRIFSKSDCNKNFISNIRFLPDDKQQKVLDKPSEGKGAYINLATVPTMRTCNNEKHLKLDEHSVEMTRHTKERLNNDINFVETEERDEIKEEPDSEDLETAGQYEVNVRNIEWDDDEDDMAVILIIREISHRNKIMKLEQLHEIKDKMLASVSHDLRTPINGIIGLVQTTIDMVRDPEITNTLVLAINSANSLLLLINDLLDITQLKEGKLTLNFAYVKIKDLIEPVMKLVEYTAKKKNINLVLENRISENVMVRADINRFKQILFNLLGNAVKFTNKGHIKLIIGEKASFKPMEFNHLNFGSEGQASLNSKARASAKEISFCSNLSEDSSGPKELDKVVEFIVEDTGIGIRPNDIEKLLKPFGKLKNKENPTGVGLGLAISNTLAQMMSPKFEQGIHIKSEYGKGSSFGFQLNSILVKDEQIIGSTSLIFNANEFSKVNRVNTLRDFEITVTRKLGRKTNTLIVDDDSINQLVVKNYLKSFENLEINTANNGEEAIQAVQEALHNKKYFDLIFMDCNMPIMNGFESTERINELVARQLIPKPKIFALTGYSSEDETRRCVNLGMTVMVKPLNKENFISAVRSPLA